jgi:hypothetical protein
MATQYARAASRGFSYLVPTTVNATLKKLLKKLPSTARPIYKDYYGDIMGSRACAQVSADALAAFVEESFPRISADHNRLAKLMNAAIDEDEHDGYDPVKFPVVADGTAADTDDEDERAPQSRKRPGMWSLPEGKRAKAVKKSRALPVAESPSSLEPELRGVLWSTGTIAKPENEIDTMATPEPESRDKYSLLPWSPIDTTVPPPTIRTMEMSTTMANTDTMYPYPLNASLSHSVYEPLEDSEGNVQGDTVLSPDLVSRVRNNLFGIPDAEAPEAVPADTTNNFGVDPADMPAPLDDSLWTLGNWVDGLDAIDALPATWF